MNAPWVTLWNQVKASVGNDSSVEVEDLDQSSAQYAIRVVAKTRHKALGIASVMKPRHEFANVVVLVEVKDAQGDTISPVIPNSAREFADQVQSAFQGNDWYREVAVKNLFGQPRVFPVFAKSVIQFLNDDLSDLYTNYNGVTAAVFEEVLVESSGGFPLLCSTDNR